MARLIQKWQAIDGSEWITADEAVARETLLHSVAVALASLGERDKRLENNEGYIQHSEYAVRAAKLAVHEIAKAGALKWWFDEQREKHGKSDEDLALRVHVSWQMRMLDGDCEPLNRAYFRLSTIDDQFREWQQPYYANNPDEGKQVRLN